MANQTDAYLETLRAGMKGKISRQKADEILSEARTHLEDEILELTAQGQDRESAEVSAISRFGEAEQVRDWYLSAHGRPSIWKAVRWPLAILLGWIYALQLWYAVGLPFRLETKLISIDFHFLIILGGFAWLVAACYRSKRFTSGVMALGVTAFCGLHFLYSCLFQVPIAGEHGYYTIPKWSIEGRLAEITAEKLRAERRLAMLELGYREFASFTPTEGAKLFQTRSGQYMTPAYFQMRDFPSSTSYLGRDRWDGLQDSWAQARNFWRDQPHSVSKSGRSEIYFLTEVKDETLVAERNLKELPIAASKPFTEHLAVFAQVFTFLLPATFAKGAVADLIGGSLRLVTEFLRTRRRRKGPLVA